MMNPRRIDYGVYLVTDTTPAVLGQGDLAQIVEASLRGGATCVQHRDKHGPLDAVLATARRLHAITRSFGVPLIINDWVEVAAEIGCEGVHLGRDDMAVDQARNMLPPGSIIGVTANSTEEAIRACENGADYLGIGTLFATPTKKDTRSIIGTSGARAILSALEAAGYGQVPCVGIGGIELSNAASVLEKCRSWRKSLDGLAVVSALVSAPDAAAAARHLLGALLLSRVPRVICEVVDRVALTHNMTNLVVQNLAANVALAIGASPIMSNNADEAADLAKLQGALVINTGTVTTESLRNQMLALQAYNEAGRPVILDPVGMGATAIRRQAVESLLSAGRFAVIKGNLSEMLALHGSPARQHGVDSTASLDSGALASLARSLARAHKCVVVVTGSTDVVSDGQRTVAVENGHALLGAITGSGCSLGTAIGAMAAVGASSDLLAAVVAAVVLFGVASQVAVESGQVEGPGSFTPAFIDQLWRLQRDTAKGDLRWLALAKLRVVPVPDEATEP